jgi:hypothetical protein
MRPEDLEKIKSPIAPGPAPEPGQLATELAQQLPRFSPSQLSPQLEKFAHYIASGMPQSAAAVAVGMSPGWASAALDKPGVKAAIEALRERNRERLDFTVETAHGMYLDALEVAKHTSDATAMKNIVDSLVKLHGIAAAPKPVKIDMNITNKRQVERLTDEQLLEEAGFSLDYMTPKPKQRALPQPIVEGEFTEVPRNNE